MTSFATDKIWPHGYFQEYAKIAGQLGPRARVLELGVLGGGSLRMWQALFPQGDITGLDANPQAHWPPGTHQVIAAQDDPQLPAVLGHRQFDLIIDDASHDGGLTAASFRLLWPLIAPGGVYVIEDWMVSLRDADRPGETWGESARWGEGMLRTVQELIRLLDYPDSPCEQVRYRYGMAIVHRRAHE